MAETRIIELISQTLTELLEHLQFPFDKIEVEEEESGVIRANIETERVPFLIGTHGERIDALQHILKNILWSKEGINDYFVIIDVDGYKKSREEKMLKIAEEKAEAVSETGISQIMPPIDPYIRRMVHLHIKNSKYTGVTTESVGEGQQRRLQISRK